MSNVSANHKDNVFCLLYREKKHLLSLYNAVNGTSYENEEELDVVTLEDAICMKIKNDAAFVIDARLNLYEQQSTVNPNMPLRDLYYIAEELKRMMPPGRLYGRARVKIPAPRFIVFYNGKEKQPPEYSLRLSDLFEKEEEKERPELELTVRVININPGNNGELLESCESLRGYMQFVSKVREKKESGFSTEESVRQSVEECIEEDVLAEFFKEHKKDVVEMSIWEYDEELHMQIIKEEGIEEGIEKGIEKGLSLVNQLGKILSKAGRTDEFLASLEDEKLQKELLMEFGLMDEMTDDKG